MTDSTIVFIRLQRTKSEIIDKAGFEVSMTVFNQLIVEFKSNGKCRERDLLVSLGKET